MSGDLQSLIDDFRQKQPLDLGEGLALLDDLRSRGSDEQVRELEELLHVNDSSMERAVECMSKLNELECTLNETTTAYEDVLSECRDAMNRLDFVPRAERLDKAELEIEKVAEKARQMEEDVKEMKKSVEGAVSDFKRSLDMIEVQVTKAVGLLKESETARISQPTGVELPKCSRAWTGPMETRQHGYKCYTCGLHNDKLICEECARHCHICHQLRDCGVRQFMCACGRHGTACQIDHEPCRCSYYLTGNNYKMQGHWHCHTCGYTHGTLVCTACATHCHQGHNVEWADWDDCFCDCGASGKCAICPSRR